MSTQPQEEIMGRRKLTPDGWRKEMEQLRKAEEQARFKLRQQRVKTTQLEDAQEKAAQMDTQWKHSKEMGAARREERKLQDKVDAAIKARREMQRDKPEPEQMD